MVYMNARLFINFLFWQQTAVLEAHPPLLALRESKELARSLPEAPRLERPLYRGAIVASVWLLLLLVLTFGVQLPFMLVRFIGVENPEQAMALMRKMAEAQTPDALMIAADIVTAAINLLLRPFLAAAFVVLYYDAKARSGRVAEKSARIDRGQAVRFRKNRIFLAASRQFRHDWFPLPGICRGGGHGGSHKEVRFTLGNTALARGVGWTGRPIQTLGQHPASSRTQKSMEVVTRTGCRGAPVAGPDRGCAKQKILDDANIDAQGAGERSK